MANWQKNNRAHACLSFFETWHHNRREVKFTPSGEWDTNFLIKSATEESPDMRASKAKAHAEMLDGAFTGLFGAKYEENVTREDALNAMFQILNEPGKKLKDLGNPVDASYQFIGETS